MTGLIFAAEGAGEPPILSMIPIDLTALTLEN
jgi:hypothetical protein